MLQKQFVYQPRTWAEQIRWHKMKSLIIISAFAILSAAGVAGSVGCCRVQKTFSKKVLNFYIDLNGECFVDKRNKGRILPFRAKSVSPKSLTIEKCQKACFEENDYVYAGVQAGNRCFCGNATPTSRASSESECNKKCRGDKSQICGGKLRMNIYVNKGWSWFYWFLYDVKHFSVWEKILKGRVASPIQLFNSI